MAEDEKTNLRLEIAHVLFMDIVGYSKLLIDEQREALHELNNLVRNTDAVREAEAANQLIRLPTGDGMALVFTSSMEAPVECALQISQALRAQPSLPLRMGIHSGPVQHVSDVNDRENIAGSGINIAQRVMDCGDAGHILVSKRVADDLAGSRRWVPYLHELGDCEVKHGVVSMVNLYADVVGNPVRPAKFGGAKASRRKLVPAGGARPGASRWLLGAGALLVVAAAVAFFLWQRGGSGRRVMPAVAPLAASPTVPVPTPAPALAEAPEKSVAVLPFDNFSEDKDSAFFAEGVQDEVLTDLAKVADLKVISRSSVIQYKDAKQRNLREVGRALGVSHVVEGSVQRAGNKIRVTAQLIDARTDSHQWAEHYDRPLDDVFAIQSEIAQSIAAQLQAAMSPAEHAAMEEAPTHDEQAYQLYLRALALMDQYNTGDIQALCKDSLDLLRQATARDPGFARAFTLMARAQAVLYFNFGGTPADAGAARDDAATVARLRPDSPEAHMAMGYYDYYVQHDYPRAHEDFSQAVQQSPNDARALATLGAIERRQGRWEAALAHLRQSQELDPENSNTFTIYVELLRALQRYPEAVALYDRHLASHPQDLESRVLKARLLLDWKADTRAARAEVASLPLGFDPEGEVTDLRIDCDQGERDFAAAARDLAACPLAMIYGEHRGLLEGFIARYRGDAAAAAVSFGTLRLQLQAQERDEPGRFGPIVSLAVAEAALGHKEEAMAALHRYTAIGLSDDAMQSPRDVSTRSRILAMLGEREEAIRILQPVCGQPYGPTYGDLRLDPIWDPLRGDARFEAMAASLAPKP